MARPGARNHPKIKRYCHMIGRAWSDARGPLETMWEVGYETGDPVLGDRDDIEIAAEWTGEKGLFATAVIECRLVDLVEVGVYRIHNLLKHAPEYVRRRWAKEQERKALKICEWCHKTFQSSQSNARFCCDAHRISAYRSDTPVNGSALTTCNDTPAPTPTPTPLILEIDCSEPPKAASEPSDLDPVFLTFECIGAMPGSPAPKFELRMSRLSSYAQAFPGVDVKSEARRAMEWWTCNPSKRKTVRGTPSFLYRWFAREQDRGGRKAPDLAARRETTTQRLDRIRKESEAAARERAVVQAEPNGTTFHELLNGIGKKPIPPGRYSAQQSACNARNEEFMRAHGLR